MSDFTPEHIGSFSPTRLAKVQFQYTPTLATLLSNLVGPNDGVMPVAQDSEDASAGQRKPGNQRPRDTAIIVTTSMALLCYATSDLSNALQGIMGYFLFASNTAKRCIEVLHRLGLTATYGTINSALRFNAEASLVKMRKVVLNRRFFVSFDNMNLHCATRDQRRHNHSHQNNYTAGCICAMECCGEAECDCGPLSADSIDRKAALNLSFCDLDLSVQEF